MTPIFVDAAPQPQHYLSPPTILFKVASIKPHSYAQTWIKDQQTAELYSVFHSLRQGFIRGIIHICIITDNMGTYHTLSSGKISARITRLIYQYRANTQVMWVPTADTFSRSLTPQQPPPCEPHYLLYINTCRNLKRFWWLS